MDSNTSLLDPSQKDVNIKKGPHPRTHDKGKDTNQPPQSKMFQKRKKPSQVRAHGAHILVQSTIPILTELILASVIDASPTNVEKQAHSFYIPPPTPQSQISSEIALIDNQTFSNYPYLQLKKETKL